MKRTILGFVLGLTVTAAFAGDVPQVRSRADINISLHKQSIARITGLEKRLGGFAEREKLLLKRVDILEQAVAQLQAAK